MACRRYGIGYIRVPHPLYISHRRLAEEPLIFPDEVRGVVVAHPAAGGVQIVAGHPLGDAGSLAPTRGWRSPSALSATTAVRQAFPAVSCMHRSMGNSGGACGLRL